MKKSLFEISNGVFYEVAQSSVDEINFRGSEKIEFPIIEKTPKCRVTIPKPRKQNQVCFFEGCVFENYDEDYETIWSLYLATVSHMAAHAKISDYTKYESWIKNKTFEKCQRVIDFVEDIRVEEYLKKSFPDIWENLASIKIIFDDLDENEISNHLNEKFYNSFCDNKSSVIQKLREKLSGVNEIEVDDIVPFLDFLYKNQNLLPKNSLPYCMHRDDGFSHNGYLKNIKIQPKGKFARIVSEMDDIWNKEKSKDDKKLIEYQDLVEDSHFDEIIVGSENLPEFTRLANESAGALKKVRTKAKTITNIVEAPSMEDAGLLNMQFAIQREATKKDGMGIFEQDPPRVETENWLVIIDASASMIAKFEEMKKMALCLSEAAEQLNQGKGKWGLYGFNNNFLVVKDHIEKYNQQTKARIGGIENKGYSMIPDAINIGTKILKRDHESTRKYLILISDGRPFGYENIDECFKKSLQNAKEYGIKIIGIGVPDVLSKYFSFTIKADSPEKSVDRFMKAYSYLTQTIN